MASASPQKPAERRETIISNRTLPTVQWRAGDLCEAKHLAQDNPHKLTRWYAASIGKVLPDGRCDVQYDDGDFEAHVPLKFLRARKDGSGPSGPPASTAASSAQAQEQEQAQAPPTSDGGSGLIVSGKRKVRATTVMVDGHAVKRQNMYDMEEGEGSVWDRELSAGGVYADPAFAYREREAPAPVAEKPKAKAPAAPREASAEEKERLKRNEQMKAAKKAQAKARLRFLEPHRQILGRFGASLPKLSAAEKAEAEAANEATGAPSGAGGFFEDPAVTPPSDILVEMRDYQQRGLRWLVGMHRCGVNAILADEMGLGKTLQTIAFLAYLKFVEGVPGPHLVICPVPRALPSLPPSLPAPRPRRPRRLCASC